MQLFGWGQGQQPLWMKRPRESRGIKVHSPEQNDIGLGDRLDVLGRLTDLDSRTESTELLEGTLELLDSLDAVDGSDEPTGSAKDVKVSFHELDRALRGYRSRSEQCDRC